MRRAVAVGALGVVLVAVAVVTVGRWERAHHADRENAGIERVYTAVGELDGPTLAGFRFLGEFQCLIYSRGGRPFALELCVDWDGRAIEGIDRRGGDVEIWSLREDAERARVQVDRARFERLIERMCTECGAIFDRGREPGGQPRR